MVPNNVVNVFVIMLLDTLKKSPNVYKMTATITRLTALALSRQEHSPGGMERMMGPPLADFPTTELILMPIIFNKHYHLLVLDKVKEEYLNYDSIGRHAHDRDIVAMVITTFNHFGF